MIGSVNDLEERVSKLETVNKQLVEAVKLLMMAQGIRPEPQEPKAITETRQAQ